jgi:alpha-L-fucosidase
MPNNRSRVLFVSSAILVCQLFTQTAQAQPPSLDSLQRAHEELRFGMFICLNMNTFYPGWAEDRVDPKLFAPTKLDCGQWMRAMKSAGMTYGLLTTKHHDGFAIWPSQQTPPNGKTKYTIAQSAVPNRDVVREYVDSCRAYGMLPGLYYSMWDVASGIGGAYAVTDTIDWNKVKPFVLGQITELLGGTYGKIPLFAFDGYSWKMGHKQVPYQEIRTLIKKLQPQCLIMDHTGACPWEVDIRYFEEPLKIQMPAGNTIASCQGQTISGDWFWDASATDINQLMTVAAIMEHLTRLEKGWCNFLLNCPPNRSGVLDAAVVSRLAEVGKVWKPDLTRAKLPTQPDLIERPITPITSTATSGSAKLACDGLNDFKNSTKEGPRFQTLWQSSASLPQAVTLNYGAIYDSIDMLMYLPRRDSVTTGNITKYSIFVSTNGINFTKVDSGTWAGDNEIKRAYFVKQRAQYVKFQADAAVGGYAIIGELSAGSHKIPWNTTATVTTSGSEALSKKNIIMQSVLGSSGRITIKLPFKLRADTRVTMFDFAGKSIPFAIESSGAGISINHLSTGVFGLSNSMFVIKLDHAGKL